MIKQKDSATFLRRLIIFLSIVILGIIVDIITKRLASDYLKGNPSFVLIPNALQLTYLENQGAAFGMLVDAPWIFNTVSILAMVIIIPYVLIKKNLHTLSVIGLSLIVSGGIGNLIERLSKGFVVDFIDFCLIHFAVFNAADSWVTIGCFMLIFSLILQMVKEAKEAKK